MKDYYTNKMASDLESLARTARLASLESQLQLLEDMERVIKSYYTIHGKIDLEDMERLIEGYWQEAYGKMESLGGNE